METSLEQFQNALYPMSATSLGTEMVLKLAHEANARGSMVARLLGRWMPFKLEHPRKALWPMLVTVVGSVTLARLEQDSKDDAGIWPTPLGMVMARSFKQYV